MGRYGGAGELDAGTLFLASDAASCVTGAILPVDGGYACVRARDALSPFHARHYLSRKNRSTMHDNEVRKK
jgi:hypothetical protein